MTGNTDSVTIHILSLGAGVQSSTLALMAARGEVVGYPRLSGAIFADTQDEPASVYKWLDWLESEIALSPFPFPVHRVTNGKLSEHALKMRTTRDGRRFSSADIPVFTRSAHGNVGKVANRKCTSDFKIVPILKTARKLAGIKRGQKRIGLVQWIGISLDEVRRMKPARDPWVKNAWPLIDMKMRRGDCLEWMKRNGYPQPPRSSCVYCPFHRNDEWRRLKNDEPEAFAQAVDFERKLQEAKGNSDDFHAVPFLHRSCKPLDQVDFSSDEDRGQIVFDFNNECTGMCGV